MYGFPFFDMSGDNKPRLDLSSGADGDKQLGIDASMASMVKKPNATAATTVVVSKPLSSNNISIDNKSTRVCPSDTKTCPDGTILHRDPANFCRFPLCSAVPPPSHCGTDTKTCSDGTIVHHDPNHDCKFPTCPTSPANPNQSYIDAYISVMGSSPSSTQLSKWLNLWKILKRQPTSTEYNCYIQTGKPTCTSSCPADQNPQKCPDGSLQKKDANCNYLPCDQSTYQKYIDAFYAAFNVMPTEAQLENWIYLWGQLGHQPTGEEFNCYVSTGNPVCTTSTDTSTGTSSGGGGAAPTEDSTAGAPGIAAKDKKWILYAGIAAAIIGIGGLLMGKTKLT
jgi:hypothetical protein